MRDRIQRSKLNRARRNNSGVALIVAVVIITILIIFTFSLMLAAYSLYSSQNKNVASMRCREAANTLSAALGEELTYVSTTNERYPEFESYLYNYLRYNLCQKDTWPYYQKGVTGHGEQEAFRYFDLKHTAGKAVQGEGGQIANNEQRTITNVEGMPGKTTVCIYWEPPTGVDTSENGSRLSAEDKNGILLHVIVTCESASQSCRVEKQYQLRVGGYDIYSRTRQNCMIDKSSDQSVNPLNYSMETAELRTALIDTAERWFWDVLDETE